MKVNETQQLLAKQIQAEKRKWESMARRQQLEQMPYTPLATELASRGKLNASLNNKWTSEGHYHVLRALESLCQGAKSSEKEPS